MKDFFKTHPLAALVYAVIIVGLIYLGYSYVEDKISNYKIAKYEQRIEQLNSNITDLTNKNKTLSDTYNNLMVTYNQKEEEVSRLQQIATSNDMRLKAIDKKLSNLTLKTNLSPENASDKQRCSDQCKALNDLGYQCDERVYCAKFP